MFNPYILAEMYNWGQVFYRHRSYDPKTIQEYESLLNSENLPQTLPEHYIARIDEMEQEVLGEEAPLITVQRNLQAKVENVASIGMRILSRISHAEEEERKNRLRDTHREQQQILTRLNETLTRHNEVIVRAKAAFDECRTRARRMSTQVEDEMLAEELRKEGEASAVVAAASEEAIRVTMEAITGRLTELQSGLRVRIADNATLFADEREDLEAEFQRYEQLAEAAYGTLERTQ